MAVGAVGYLVKDAGGAEVVAAVRRAHERGVGPVREREGGTGDRGVGPPEGDHEQAPLPRLTEREREILQLLANGHRPGEVADRLVISPKTVRNHLHNIYGRLGVDDRSQAIVVALRHGLIDIAG